VLRYFRNQESVRWRAASVRCGDREIGARRQNAKLREFRPQKGGGVIAAESSLNLAHQRLGKSVGISGKVIQDLAIRPLRYYLLTKRRESSNDAKRRNVQVTV